MNTDNHIKNINDASIAKRALYQIVLEVSDDMNIDWAEPDDLYTFPDDEAQRLAPDLDTAVENASADSTVADGLSQLVDFYELHCAKTAIEALPPEQADALRQTVRDVLAPYAQ